jgi:chromosome segregation ATPase
MEKYKSIPGLLSIQWGQLGLNVRTTVAGMALIVLGIFIPIVGWFTLLPVGLIALLVGLVTQEKVVAVKSALSPEEVLLDVDMVTSEMGAIARKLPEFSQAAKTNVELVDQYATCLKDAESKIGLVKNLEGPLIQIIEKAKQQLQATESALTSLERSREVYGVQAESLDTKIVQEKARLGELRTNIEKWENMLRELRSKRKQLMGLLDSEEASSMPENAGLYLKVLLKYREKYGEAAEKKLNRDLVLGGRRLEELYNLLYREEKP